MQSSVDMTCCFTGHRPGHGGIRYVEEEPRYHELTDLLDRAILIAVDRGVRMFLCGMADGFDLVAAKRMLALRRTGRLSRDVRLIAVQPFPDHKHTISGERWQQDYEEVLQCADDVCVVSAQYHKDAYLRRNAFMVERSMWVIAYWNGAQRSGSGQTVRMAQRLDRSIVNLYDL